ncbi:MAG: divalent-cation tolerance protein CutA [Patescibacteria group bacterium]|jgi:periplasmic divalent cation tolerance protein
MGITIYVTYPSLTEAKKITDKLLAQKLVACVTFFPIKSKFWWQGKIQQANEVVTLLTTKKENWAKVRAEIKKMHSYKVPCIEKTEFAANIDYEDWIKKVTK